jgi:HSP20 family protein
MSLKRREQNRVWPLDTGWSQDVVDTTFRDMLRGFFAGESLFDRAGAGGAHLMKIEEFTDDDTCVIRAELPGVDPEKDVEITVSDGVLRLQATREQRTEVERPHGYRTEFRYGSLVRSLQLPRGVDESGVTATYQDGILEIRVPAPAEETDPDATRKIPISRG